MWSVLLKTCNVICESVLSGDDKFTTVEADQARRDHEKNKLIFSCCSREVMHSLPLYRRPCLATLRTAQTFLADLLRRGGRWPAERPSEFERMHCVLRDRRLKRPTELSLGDDPQGRSLYCCARQIATVRQRDCMGGLNKYQSL